MLILLFFCKMIYFIGFRLLGLGALSTNTSKVRDYLWLIKNLDYFRLINKRLDHSRLFFPKNKYHVLFN